MESLKTLTETVSDFHEVKNANRQDKLIVGVLRKKTTKLPKYSELYLMTCMAKSFNIELYFFTAQDIHIQDKTVDAVLIEGNLCTPKTIPLPTIIYNDEDSYTDESAKEVKPLIKKECYLVRNGVVSTKKKIYDILNADGRFRSFLIETHPCKSFEEFLSLFEDYNHDVILKPEDGMQGKGIVRITFNEKQYVINDNTERFILNNVTELKDYYSEHFAQLKYILQPYIVSRTKDGNPFDVRLHACRGAQGKFCLIIYPRIGRNSKGILSNISAGGYTTSIYRFLKQEYGDEYETVYRKLATLGYTFPDYFQSFFQTKIQAMALDVGIQRVGDSYELKIFEVQSIGHGTSFLEQYVSVMNMEYLQYLGERLVTGTLWDNV